MEVKFTRLLRGINEREREVKGDSKTWGLHNCQNGTPVIPMRKVAKGTGLEVSGPGGVGPQEGDVGRTTERMGPNKLGKGCFKQEVWSEGPWHRQCSDYH